MYRPEPCLTQSNWSARLVIGQHQSVSQVLRPKTLRKGASRCGKNVQDDQPSSQVNAAFQKLEPRTFGGVKECLRSTVNGGRVVNKDGAS